MKIKGSSVIILILCIVIAVCVVYIAKLNNKVDNNVSKSEEKKTTVVQNTSKENTSNESVGSYTEDRELPSDEEIKADIEKEEQIRDKLMELEMANTSINDWYENKANEGVDSSASQEEQEIQKEANRYELRYLLQEKEDIKAELRELLK